jgi:hypothetical protein
MSVGYMMLRLSFALIVADRRIYNEVMPSDLNMNRRHISDYTFKKTTIFEKIYFLRNTVYSSPL